MIICTYVNAYAHELCKNSWLRIFVKKKIPTASHSTMMQTTWFSNNYNAAVRCTRIDSLVNALCVQRFVYAFVSLMVRRMGKFLVRKYSLFTIIKYSHDYSHWVQITVLISNNNNNNSKQQQQKKIAHTHTFDTFAGLCQKKVILGGKKHHAALVKRHAYLYGL